MSGAVPLPAARPLGRAAGVPRPVCPGCGWCGRGDPAPAPQRAPLWAGVAHVGVAEGRPRGGAFRRCEGRLRSGAPPPPTARPLGGLSGSTTTCCERACAGVGAHHCPLGLHALWGLRAAGVVGGRSRGGWPATVVRGVWCQALSLPRRPSSGAGSRGSATHVSRVRLVRAWGPSTGPTACAFAGRRCALWGWRQGVPGGGCLSPL